jgi:hypothetical protein
LPGEAPGLLADNDIAYIYTSRHKTEHFLRHFVIPLPLRQPVQSAVDPLGDGREVLDIRQFIEALHLPEEARGLERVFRLGRQIGIADQVDAEQAAVLLVIGPACNLDRAAAAVTETIARPRFWPRGFSPAAY